MNTRRSGRLVLAGGLIALLAAAQGPRALAQAPATEAAAAEGPPLFRIEVIVFAYNEGNFGEEDFRHIAQRDVSPAPMPAAGTLDLAVFDFEPYLPEESELPIEGSELDALGADGLDAAETLPDAEGATEPLPGAERAIAAEALPGAEGDEPAQLITAESEADPGTVEAAPATDELIETTPPLMVGPPAEAAGPAAVGPPAEAAGPAAPEAEAVIDPFGGPGNVLAPFRFRLLEQDELTLAGLRQRLARLNAYTPLLHGGWIQEALPPQQAQPFDFAYLGVTNPAGTLRLHISRFLHLTLDLEFRELLAPPARRSQEEGSEEPGALAQRAAPADVPSGAFASRPALSARALTEIEVSRRYYLNAERRIRSTEVHYFDNPFFGVIVVVQPYEPPVPPAEGVGPAA